MKHTSASTLVREEQGIRLVEPPIETPGIPRSPDARRIAPGDQPSSTHRIGRISEGRIVYLLAFGAYFTVAWLVAFKYHNSPADAYSRMANGFYVLYSDDPHLAAIGFVWEPLQSIADAVVLLGNHLWPALSRNDMAGNLVSAFSMAGAVYQMCAALREWGVSRAPRLVLTAFFAFNPMILYYGGNGMSEALYLFLLITCTRYLLRWMRDGDLRSLAYSAVALGFCYLTRNEAALAALMGGLAVGAVSYWRARGRPASRLRTGASDLAIFSVPAFTAAVGWAVTSYVIIGAFIDGGSLGVRLKNQKLYSSNTLHTRVIYAIHALGALAPFLPILLVVAAVVAFWMKDPRTLAPLAVLGGALGFDAFSFLDNAIGNSLRYWIAVIPLGVLLLGSLVAAVQTPRPARVGVPFPTRSSRYGVRALGVVAALCLVLAGMIPTTLLTGSGMGNPQIGTDESVELGFIFHPGAPKFKLPVIYPFAQAADRYLEGRHLPDGDVVVDNADGTGCVPQMVVMSNQPKLFVIPNDRNFQPVLADPIAFHAHYLLVPDPTDGGAINLLYPSLWKTGAGFTKLAHQFTAQPGSACTDFRLFHVLGHSNQVS